MADEKPTDRIRVKHKDSGHHSTIARRAFDPDRQELLKSPATTKWGTDVPPKYHVTKGGSPATASSPRSGTPAEKKNEEPQT